MQVVHQFEVVQQAMGYAWSHSDESNPNFDDPKTRISINIGVEQRISKYLSDSGLVTFITELMAIEVNMWRT